MEGEYSDDTDIHVLFVFILHKRHVATEEGGGGSPFIVRNIEIYTLYIYHTWAFNCILSFKPIGPSILAPPFPHFLTLREKNPMPCSVRGFLTFSQNSRINIFFVTRYVSKSVYTYIYLPVWLHCISILLINLFLYCIGNLKILGCWYLYLFDTLFFDIIHFSNITWKHN